MISNSDVNVLEVKGYSFLNDSYLFLFGQCLTVVIVGESAVGKSSLTLKFVNNQYKENTIATIGAAYLSKTLPIDRKSSIKFNIWDTAGQEKYRQVSRLRSPSISKRGHTFGTDRWPRYTIGGQIAQSSRMTSQIGLASYDVVCDRSTSH